MKTDFWTNCLNSFEQQLPSQQFKTWIMPLKVTWQDETLQIVAPNRFIEERVKQKFQAQIYSFANQQLDFDLKIVWVCGEAVSEIKKSPITKVNMSSTTKKEKKPNENGLKAEWTFDNYVSGRANQMARTVGLQIAELPGQNIYNPLFIYGSTGLGKTHLLQAIGNHTRICYPKAKIQYLRAEQYISEVTKCYGARTGDQNHFKEKYYSLDLLLIDDIQFFANKTRTQEEFFYAFNALTEAGKQIVISCDTYPQEITHVDERLRTRFGQGLTVAIEPPEFEMRVAILFKKSDSLGVHISDVVASFIASNIKSSVRELEGALNQVIARAKFTCQPLSLDLAKESLKDTISAKSHRITVDQIQKTVANYYKIKLVDLLGKKRTQSFSRPRQIAMSLARDLTNHSFPEIGNAFDNRHHTTVLHAYREIETLKHADPDIARDVTILTQLLNSV